MKKIINQLKQIRPELQGLLEYGVDIHITSNNSFSLPYIADKRVNLHNEMPVDNVAIVIEIAYVLQAAILIRSFPEKRLACCILARQFAFEYMNSLRKIDKESYKTFLLKNSIDEYRLREAYESLCDASAEIKARCFGTYLLEQYFPEQNANQLIEEVDLAMLAWHLACPTHILLTQGGDERLHISPETGVNKYHVPSFPQSDIIIRSSCTCSPPTVSGFVSAELLRQKLLIAALKKELPRAFSTSMKNVRDRISIAFELTHSQPFLLCTPSGTDTEILITYLALCQYQKMRFQSMDEQTSESTKVALVCHIFMASSEVGSNAVAASECRYFSSYSPDGSQVAMGDCIEGFDEKNVEVIALPARNDNGTIKDIESLENELKYLVQESIEKKGQIVVLHKVDCSKTGIKTPSFSFLYRLKQKYQNNLVIVVDAAQMRCETIAISKYLNAGFCVLCTGSKFFSGSPFSGLLLLPHQEESYFLTQEAVPNLGSYFAKDDVDERLGVLRNSLPDRKNYGLLLRWEIALENIEKYITIPMEKRTYIISQWLEQAKCLVAETEYVNVFTEDVTEVDRRIDRLGGCNTIISVTFHPECGEALDVESLKTVYQWMATDISTLLPNYATVEEYSIAQQKCLLGQPVNIRTGQSRFGILRIALGSPMICRMAEQNRIGDIRIVEQHPESLPLQFLEKTKLEDRKTFLERRINYTPITLKRYVSVDKKIKCELNYDKQVLDKLALIGKYYYFLKKY